MSPRALTVLKMAAEMRPRAWMAKVDFRRGFGHLGLCRSVRSLFAFKGVDGNLYRFTTVPFGLGSAPCIFSIVSGELARILRVSFPALTVTVYLDDISILGDTEDAVNAGLDFFLKLCADTGFNIADDKTHRSSQSMVFLGMRFDTVKMTLSYPEEKRRRTAAAADNRTRTPRGSRPGPGPHGTSIRGFRGREWTGD